MQTGLLSWIQLPEAECRMDLSWSCNLRGEGVREAHGSGKHWASCGLGETGFSLIPGSSGAQVTPESWFLLEVQPDSQLDSVFDGQPLGSAGGRVSLEHRGANHGQSVLGVGHLYLMEGILVATYSMGHNCLNYKSSFQARTNWVPRAFP